MSSTHRSMRTTRYYCPASSSKSAKGAKTRQGIQFELDFLASLALVALRIFRPFEYPPAPREVRMSDELHLLSPRGFRAGAVYAGIKSKQTPDVGLLVCDTLAT